MRGFPPGAREEIIEGISRILGGTFYRELVKQSVGLVGKQVAYAVISPLDIVAIVAVMPERKD
jgi:hypothetical protein